MILFKPFAAACSLGLLSLAAADQQQQEAVGDDVVPVAPSRQLGLDPSTFQHTLDIRVLRAEGLVANCRQWEAEWLEENPTEQEQAGIHQRIENLENLLHEESQIVLEGI